ncbi:hypothetical protein Goarm_015188 [Gossypium armourianum]|uniref:Uncharacterized protein n=1 Tax=Gossypium armourianum TaxID=34283 RepID=A0A7J9J8G9_9ROSI|nr:hypothetical protein [Gossypium armourianum]
MNRTHSPIPTVKSPFHFVLSPNFKSLIHPTATRILNFPPKHPNRLPLLSYCSKSPNFRFISKKRNFEVKASTGSNNGEAGNWVRWLPTGGLAADKVLRLISTATSSPICQFISSPTTFLHSVDPRIKLVWLLVLVVLPARAQIAVRFGLVAYIAVLSMLFLPKNVWMVRHPLNCDGCWSLTLLHCCSVRLKLCSNLSHFISSLTCMDQLGRVSLLCGILFVLSGLGTDGVPQLLQSRTPPSSLTGLPDLPKSLSGYSYLIMKLGPLQFTRKGLSVASTASCLTFIVSCLLHK